MNSPEDTNLIEISVHIRGKEYQSPVIRRLFFDRKSGGLSLHPVFAERGQDSDSEIARQIAWELKREPFHTDKDKPK